MKDTLFIESLHINTRIGVHDWEQRIDQPLYLTLQISYDFSGCDDDINKTLNYDAICQSIEEFMQDKSYKLIETLAHNLAIFLKEAFQLVEITLSVSKPYALKQAKDTRVTVTR